MRRASVIVLGAWVAGCGAPAPPAVAGSARPNDNGPPAAVALAPATPAYPAERAVLIDGVRMGRVLDTLDGFQLVHGAGTVAIVGPEGHVRASHRFAFGAGGASAIFLDARHAVVGNGDHDGFLGPWAAGLHRWEIDTDTLERLAGLGYAAPMMARLPGVAVVLDPTITALFGVHARGDVDTLEAHGDQLVCPSEHACFVTSTEEAWRVRRGPDGRLTVTPHEGPVTARAPEPPPATLSSIGARGLPVAELAPTAGRLLVATSSSMAVLGPEGIGPELVVTMEPHWSTDRLVTIGNTPYPLEVPTLGRQSTRVEAIPYPMDVENQEVPEMRTFEGWQYDAREAQETGRPMPALQLPPVCSEGAPVRCLRAHVRGLDVDGWELFDPARPTRVLGRIAGRTIPPGQGYVVVGPGGRWVRDFVESATLTPLPRGEAYTDLASWVELERGWVFTLEANGATLHHVPTSGRAVTRTLGAPLSGLGIVDADHVLAVLEDGSAEVLALPSLVTTRSFSVGTEPAVLSLRCNGADLVDHRGDPVAAGGCPVQGLDVETGYSVRASADRAFWLDARLGDEVLVHRRSDGARLSVRVTTDGVLVSGPGGVFEATGGVADRVVVREPGPVRTAAITAGAEARARFERPGLVAAFFAGRPLPTP